MINPDKSLALKALAGAQFLRMHAEAMADDDDFFIALMLEPHTIAASAIEQLVKENEELREQLVTLQKATHYTVAVDPASGPDTTACYTPFVRGDRVRLKLTPEKHGTVDITRGDDSDTLSCFVHFVYPPEKHSWVSAKLLELIPDE
ncbi:hypothetical protein [Salmonella enterica]|uniref:hypothetical protein n=1 Tax=Salmonella enterica TaxID=28901 RepID=UPI000F45720B|nr:hypothetical protein [Salmonella enterica]RNM58014.1 hypothetical protein D9762_08570 [Salmonella enterica]